MRLAHDACIDIWIPAPRCGAGTTAATRSACALPWAIAAWLSAGWISERSVHGFDFPEPRPICVSPYWIHATDGNADGNLDLLAVANAIFGGPSGLAEIGVGLGDGSGSFPECTPYAEFLPFRPDGGAESVAFADFDEDGALDLLIVDGSGNGGVLGEDFGPSRLLLFPSDGTSFLPSVVAVPNIDRRHGPFPLAAADVDRDGHFDIVFGNSRLPGGPYLQIHRGDGNGGFALAYDMDLDLLPEDLEASDLNGDGHPDLTLLLYDPGSGRRTIRVLRGDGLATASDWAVVWSAGFGATVYQTRMRLGHLYASGRLDLVVVSGREIDGEQVALIYPGLGDGTFDDAVRLPVGFGAVNGVLADFDEDGRDDLLVHGEVSFQVWLSSESFQPPVPRTYLYRVDAAPHTGIEAGDFDGDGHLDLAIPGSSYRLDPSIVLIRGRGDGEFETATPRAECAGYGSAALADLNEDGVPDLVAYRQTDPDARTGALEPCVLLGLPDAVAEPFFEPLRSYEDRGADSSRPCVADFDRDGNLDVVYGYTKASGVGHPSFTLRLGDGAGGLGEARTFDAAIETSFYRTGADCADFNGDGDVDVLISGRYAFLGDGRGGFQHVWSLESEADLFNVWDSFVLADLNRDGVTDVLLNAKDVLPDHPTATWFLLGRGDGTFEPFAAVQPESAPGVPQVGNVAYASAVSDLNGDTWPDILIGFRPLGSSSWELRIHLLPTTERSGTLWVDDLAGVDIADANADGISDLLIIQSRWVSEGIFLSDLSVAYGFGDGTFVEPRWITTRPFHDVHVHDMNSDGFPDFLLVGGGIFSPGLEVLLQEAVSPGVSFHRGDSNDDGALDLSDAVFSLSYLFTGGDEPTCLEAANANDDRKVDLSDAVYVLQGLFLGGPAPPRPGPPPEPCGREPAVSPSALGCERYAHCEQDPGRR